jgi:hypothetical protein
MIAMRIYAWLNITDKAIKFYWPLGFQLPGVRIEDEGLVESNILGLEMVHKLK